MRKDYTAFLRGEQPAGTRYANIPGAAGSMRGREYTWEQAEEVIRLNCTNAPPEKLENALQWAEKCYAGSGTEIRRAV
jgi:hypothetical protein